MTSLVGKGAWILGGGSGIGRAAAEALARSGAHVVVSGRRVDPLSQTVERIRGQDGRADLVPTDASDAVDLSRAAAEVASIAGTIDVLVYSAGTNVTDRDWKELDAAGFEKVVSVNLLAAAHAVMTVLPGMRERGDGVVIVVSSWAGWAHSSGAGAAYSASKTALGALVETLNDQEGRHGIRACHLCPGEVDTEILRTRPLVPPPLERARMLRPADVARAVRFVAASPPGVCVNELVITPTWNRSYPRTAAARID